MIGQTDHGRGIAEQIQGEDCYGYRNKLNPADVYHILDNLHTHLLDASIDPDDDKLLDLVGNMINNLMVEYPDIQT